MTSGSQPRALHRHHSWQASATVSTDIPMAQHVVLPQNPLVQCFCSADWVRVIEQDVCMDIWLEFTLRRHILPCKVCASQQPRVTAA